MRKLTQRKYKAKGGDLETAYGKDGIFQAIDRISNSNRNKISKIVIQANDNEGLGRVEVNIVLSNFGDKNSIEIQTIVDGLIEKIPQRSFRDGSITATIEYDENNYPTVLKGEDPLSNE